MHEKVSSMKKPVFNKLIFVQYIKLVYLSIQDVSVYIQYFGSLTDIPFRLLQYLFN